MDILNEWEIPKVTCAITDNSANMVAAVKRALGKTKHLLCFAHTIYLIVVSSLNDSSTPVFGIIKIVRDIVKCVKPKCCEFR